MPVRNDGERDNTNFLFSKNNLEQKRKSLVRFKRCLRQMNTAIKKNNFKAYFLF